MSVTPGKPAGETFDLSLPPARPFISPPQVLYRGTTYSDVGWIKLPDMETDGETVRYGEATIPTILPDDRSRIDINGAISFSIEQLKKLEESHFVRLTAEQEKRLETSFSNLAIGASFLATDAENSAVMRSRLYVRARHQVVIETEQGAFNPMDQAQLEKYSAAYGEIAKKFKADENGTFVLKTYVPDRDNRHIDLLVSGECAQRLAAALQDLERQLKRLRPERD